MRKNGQLDDVAPSLSKTLVKGSRGNKKGVKRGPYKKKQSLDSQSVDEVIEAAIVDNDPLSPPPLGEASAEEVNDVAMTEEMRQEEQAEVAIESI
jgi:hypothetical protein